MDRVVAGVCVAPGPAGATNAATTRRRWHSRCRGSLLGERVDNPRVRWRPAPSGRNEATDAASCTASHHGARVGA